MAAAILLKEFPEAKLFPLSYGYHEKEFQAALDEIDENTTLYILDFSLHENEGAIEEVLSKNPLKIVAIDHHGARAHDSFIALDKKHEKFSFVFDNDRSGASLTWKYFHPKEDLPDIVQLVEYEDLAQWKNDPRVNSVAAYLISFTNDPQKNMELLETPIEALVEDGEKIYDFADFLMNLFLRKTLPITIKIGDHDVIAYNSTYNAQKMRTTIGKRLAEKHKETVCIFRISGDEVNMSFRGIERASPSSRDLAEMLGGGGHRDSAGAAVTLKEFMGMIVI